MREREEWSGAKAREVTSMERCMGPLGSRRRSRRPLERVARRRMRLERGALSLRERRP